MTNESTYTKNEIATLIRQIIRGEVNISTKVMHLNSRLYKSDAEGNYTKSNCLNIDIRKLEYIMLELEDVLKIDFNIPGKWCEKAGYSDTPIKYHTETQLHHLIDFVYDKYVAALGNASKSESHNSEKEVETVTKILNKKEVAALIRNTINEVTSEPVKRMHPYVRFYFNTAAGTYPTKFSGKPLNISVAELHDIAIKLCTALNVEPGFKNVADLKKQIKNPDSPLYYHKNTRLHHFVDHVYKRYADAMEYDANKMKELQNNNLEEPAMKEKEPEPVSANVRPGETIGYIISATKNGLTLFVSSHQEKLDWTIHLQDACIFSVDRINSMFDFSLDDVIFNPKKPSSLHTHLVNLSPPFDLNFSKVKVEDEDSWTYSDSDKIDSILGKLTEQEAAFIREKLK